MSVLLKNILIVVLLVQIKVKSEALPVAQLKVSSYYDSFMKVFPYKDWFSVLAHLSTK